jgi:hypothetical protein
MAASFCRGGLIHETSGMAGAQVIKYETKVYCDAGRSIEIQD